MRPYAYSGAPCTSLSYLQLDPLQYSFSEKELAGVGQALRRLIALAVVLLLAPELLAQQSPYNGQYAPEPSLGYGQRSDAQPQPYGQRLYPQQSYSTPGRADEQGYGPAQALNAQDLEQLVAPIALYPDALVAQILAASTYPAQVADADRWRRAQGYASSDQIAARADEQPWDPSVKALTAFPQVLAEMHENLHWTSELGDAYYNQPQDVLEAVQVMRRRAREAGNLNTTPQQTVSYDQGNIVLAPVNLQVVYVPAYNPWGVYGQPVSPYPGFSLVGTLASVFDSSAVRFGLGIAMNAFTHTPWGWLGWGLNWLAQSVLFNGSNYYSHSNTVARWGLPLGSPRAFPRGGATATWANSSYPTPARTAGGYGRTSAGHPGTRPQEFARTPDRDTYAANRPGERYSRSYDGAYNRTSLERFKSFQPAISRSQQYGHSSYVSNFNNRAAENSGSRTGARYGNSMRAYRAPRESFQRSDFGKRSSRGMSKGFSKSSYKQAHLGNSHLFGGRHAPKKSGGGKGFSRGHSGGGGHSGGKHHH
jgi:Protein of unknown function (DUF3300)